MSSTVPTPRATSRRERRARSTARAVLVHGVTAGVLGSAAAYVGHAYVAPYWEIRRATLLA